MQFTQILSVAILSTLSLAAPTITSSAALAAVHDPAVCEVAAGGYAEFCPRCDHLCAAQTNIYASCLVDVFSRVSYSESQCWAFGGDDCRNSAIDAVCGTQ